MSKCSGLAQTFPPGYRIIQGLSHRLRGSRAQKKTTDKTNMLGSAAYDLEDYYFPKKKGRRISEPMCKNTRVIECTIQNCNCIWIVHSIRLVCLHMGYNIYVCNYAFKIQINIYCIKHLVIYSCLYIHIYIYIYIYRPILVLYRFTFTKKIKYIYIMFENG